MGSHVLLQTSALSLASAGSFCDIPLHKGAPGSRTQKSGSHVSVHGRPAGPVASRASGGGAEPVGQQEHVTRRAALTAAAAASIVGGGLSTSGESLAASSSRRALREKQIPESDYKTLPSGLKIYDITVGKGKVATKGERVAVHYVAKWKGITFMTSRQGMGITGGTPLGFDVGSSEQGLVLKGLDEGVVGMHVGGERLLIVPPELAYGKKGVQEIPPGATLEFNVELISIKQDAFGSRVKLVEG